MIYEYIGDVISQPSFIKRMREYAEEGIRHFYFMMLQKDEVRSGLPWDVPIASTHFLWIFFLQLNSTLMQPNEEALVDS
jgi:hypothetical protein